MAMESQSCCGFSISELRGLHIRPGTSSRAPDQAIPMLSSAKNRNPDKINSEISTSNL
uniref:Uncharacterized protein n=1 Tax=Oryza punctata TaxID=4537 RepID=A0A0E0MGE2_ORYPU